MSIRVIHTLYPVTLQDAGRHGFRAFGVPLSGPMDPVSHRLSNVLCGNDSTAVVLEITLHGLLLDFEEDALIALCGGGSSPMLDGYPVGCFRPLFVQRGSKLEFKPSSNGCRMYLALAGGFDADKRMGSCATYMPAAMGGLNGRALRKGDQLFRKSPPGLLSSRIRASIERSSQEPKSALWGSNPFPSMLVKEAHLRFLPGPEWDRFLPSSREAFLSEAFDVTDRSDRMGYQLSGRVLLQNAEEEMLSTGVSVGTVQVTHAGLPVILMADGQTTGGYPRIAQIITADIPLCGQCRPGSAIRFTPISEKEAVAMYRLQMYQLSSVTQSIRIRFGL
jgi:antagonist of KipI